jgi:hypothetical protein
MMKTLFQWSIDTRLVLLPHDRRRLPDNVVNPFDDEAVHRAAAILGKPDERGMTGLVEVDGLTSCNGALPARAAPSRVRRFVLSRLNRLRSRLIGLRLNLRGGRGGGLEGEAR